MIDYNIRFYQVTFFNISLVWALPPFLIHWANLSPPFSVLDHHRNLLTDLTSSFISPPSTHFCQITFLKCKSDNAFPWPSSSMSIRHSLAHLPWQRSCSTESLRIFLVSFPTPQLECFHSWLFELSSHAVWNILPLLPFFIFSQ